MYTRRNVKYFRELPGLKQEGLAYELGEGWTQKRVSVVEQKELIEPAEPEQLAKALKMPVEAIKNFNKDQAIYNIQNNYDGSSNNNNIENYKY